MSSHVFQRGPVTPAMNITPLIDVVFLLIIFFMLVNNIIGEESTPMIVPALDTPQTRALGAADRIVVNVLPEPYNAGARRADPLLFTGEPAGVKVGLERFSMQDMAGVTRALQEAKARNPRVQVVLRADAALYYDAVQPVMAALAAAEIDTIHLVAALPEDEAPGD